MQVMCMGIHSNSNTTCVLLRTETIEKFKFEDNFLTNKLSNLRNG